MSQTVSVNDCMNEWVTLRHELARREAEIDFLKRCRDADEDEDEDRYSLQIAKLEVECKSLAPKIEQASKKVRMSVWKYTLDDNRKHEPLFARTSSKLALVQADTSGQFFK